MIRLPSKLLRSKSLLSISLLSLLLGCGQKQDIAVHELTISQFHQQLKDKQTTVAQLSVAYLERINRFDSTLNSVIAVNPNLLAEAKELDREIAAGLTDEVLQQRPLFGVPVIVKDNIDVIGMANTAGSVLLKDNVPTVNAPLIENLIKQGALILGKANLSEWANFRSEESVSGWSGMGGQARNPYDPTRSPCGSSAGSGVAVAANLAMVAIGTETDGSVVCPSAVNGIVGIKPSLGKVSGKGIIPIAHSQDTAGPMARSVSDAVALLQGMSDAYDMNLMTALKTDGIKGKRIGIAANFKGYDRKLDEAFAQAVALLKQQGAVVVEDANIDTKGQWGGHEYEVLLYEFKHDLAEYLKSTQSKYQSLGDLIEGNKTFSDQELEMFDQSIFIKANEKGTLKDTEYQQALAASKRLTQEEGIDKTIKAFNLDALIAPTTSPAWKIDEINGDHYKGSASSPAAVSGYPHITVPMGYVKGMPVGLSIFGANNSEKTLIEIAFGFEQASMARKAPSGF